MPNDIKPRNIRILRELPISQMTDEEIVKAAMDRLNTNSVLLTYNDVENKAYVFLGRYSKGGLPMQRELKYAYEEKFGKFKKLDQEEE